ncbi:MAG: helicase-exonuclease AddAB subunit AddA [Syntrophomonadaceae bacterium]
MRNWTNEQREAIEMRDRNLLVAAAAGSGKTAVLVERIIQLVIKDKIDIDQLLVVTFTQAAAAEMRERISRAIHTELEQSNEDNQEHLRRQLSLLNRASISTLHSFCTDVIKAYFHLIDIDPRFRIADSTEALMIKSECMEEMLEEQYQAASPEFLMLVEMFGGNRDDAPLSNLVLKIYDFIQSQPQPLEWLKSKANDYNMSKEEFENSSWLKTIKQNIKTRLIAAEDLFTRSLQESLLPDGPAAYTEALQDDKIIVKELLDALDRGDFDNFYNLLCSINFKRLKSAGREHREKAEAVKGWRDEAKDIINDIKNKTLHKPLEEMLVDINRLFPYINYIYYLIEEYSRIFSQNKSERGILDFNDLEHYALQVLSHPIARQEYQSRYKYIFVDEYQDSNLVQETIINYIKRENNLFMVGDVKQSIYRFRLADPGLFMQKYDDYQRCETSINWRIDLGTNFRCSQEIINSVNCLFTEIMSRELGELDYDDRVKLNYGADSNKFNDSCVELCIIDNGDDGLQDETSYPEEETPVDSAAINGYLPLSDNEVPADIIEREALFIARRIQQLLTEEIFDSQTGAYRPVEYRDIVVLMRATVNWAGQFAETFMSEGIPCYADINSGYFQAIEIELFMNLLRVIDNKRQDIPLMSVMRSPIFNFSLPEMIMIRAESKADTFYKAVEDYQLNHDDELAVKLNHFIERINIWKEESRYMSMDDFIWKLLITTGYYYYCTAMPGGQQRQANLRLLHDRARQFGQTSIKGLFNFIKFIDKLKISSGDMDIARILGENDNVVRIMSIHKSKGLEFPIVILAGTGKKFNMRDISGTVLLHKDLGIGSRYIDPELRFSTNTISRIAISNLLTTESLAEEMRILYVACTRAQHKLIMVGSVKDLTRQKNKWVKPQGIYQLSQSRNFLDWIAPIVMRHHSAAVLLPDSYHAGHPLPIVDDCNWKIVINYPPTNEQAADSTAKNDFINRWNNIEIPPSAQSDEFKAILDWTYDYKDVQDIPSKVSVTQITDLERKNLVEYAYSPPMINIKPRFLETTSAITPVQKGTVMHTVMQHLDLHRLGDGIASINRQVGEMVETEILTDQEAEVIDSQAIYEFFNSELGQRILTARNVYRETPFNLYCPASDIFKLSVTTDEKLLVQGVIDLYFEENDKLILLDFKTDRALYNLERLIRQYSIQLKWYRRALESIQQKEVSEMYLYLFENHQTIAVNNNA